MQSTIRVRALRTTQIDILKRAWKYQQSVVAGEVFEIGARTWALLETEFRGVIAKGDLEIVDAATPLTDTDGRKYQPCGLPAPKPAPVPVVDGSGRHHRRAIY